MDPITIAGIASGGASVASGAIGGILSYFGNKEDRQQRLQMYEDAKEYNDPVHQVARMQMAGLNPYSGAISGDQISDSVDLGQNPNQSLSDMFQNLGRVAQQYYSNRISKLNADTALKNAEANTYNATTNRMMAEVRKEMTSEQVKVLQDQHDFYQKTKDFRTSEANLKMQITRYLRDKYGLENAWMSEHYEDFQDAIMEGVLGKNRQTDFMTNIYYPSMLELSKKNGDLNYAKYLNDLELSHPFGANRTSANIIVNIFEALLRGLLK